MPRIGAHVSAAISLETSFKKAKEIGAEAIQFFVSPPQQWTQTQHNAEEIERYKKAAKEKGIGPNFIHGTYLINLGSFHPEHLQKSIDWLIYALKLAGKLGIRGVIFHPGSHKGREFDQVVPQVVDALNKILTQSEGEALLILETSAGSGNTLGDNFAELGTFIKAVGNPRLKICLDTQHVFAAGYDVKSKAGLDKTLEEFDREIGLESLVAIHANDSMTEFKSNRDRHANIGEGHIGIGGFKNIINHPKLKEVIFLLEVPGFNKSGPDKENVQTLKSLLF